MIASAHGVEPICKVLPIAPSTYWASFSYCLRGCEDIPVTGSPCSCLPKDGPQGWTCSLGVDHAKFEHGYSTVTLFAKLRGWSTSLPMKTAT